MKWTALVAAFLHILDYSIHTRTSKNKPRKLAFTAPPGILYVSVCGIIIGFSMSFGGPSASRRRPVVVSTEPLCYHFVSKSGYLDSLPRVVDLLILISTEPFIAPVCIKVGFLRFFFASRRRPRLISTESFYRLVPKSSFLGSF